MAPKAKPFMSPYIRYKLGELRSGPKPRQEINCGAHGRMLEMGWVREVMLPSPYKCHHGADITYFELTKMGELALEIAEARAA